MADDDDDSFGDFTFASASSSSLSPKSITVKSGAAEDDEWGDFVEYPSGSTASPLTQSKPLDPFTSKPHSPSKSLWVKPSGALPLSLFGEDEKEDDVPKPAEEKHTNTKVRNGSSNPNSGFGFDYNRNHHNLKSENGSLSNSDKLVGRDDSVNSNGLGFNFDPNSRSPTVSRVQSLNYLAGLNDDSQQISTETRDLYSSANVPSSNFSLWNLDFDTSKFNQTGLNRTSSLDALTSSNDQGLQINTQSTGLVFGLNPLSTSSANVSSSNFNFDFGTSKTNQNGLDRTLSVDALRNSNDQAFQIKTETTGLAFDSNPLSSSATVSSSNFSTWNIDFNTSKTNQNGLDRTLSVDALTSSNDQGLRIKTKSTGLVSNSNALSSSSANCTSSTFGTWGPDLDFSKSNNRNGLSRTLSLDGLTNSNDRIKTESGKLVPNSNGPSSTINASNSAFSVWDFDFGGFGSSIVTSYPTVSSDVSEPNSNSNAVGPSENLNGGLDDDDDDDDDDGWEFKDAYSMSTVGDGSNKATSEADEGHENKAMSFDFDNGLNGPVDLFAPSNESATADSKVRRAGDVQTYSSGFGNSLNGSIDLFATSNEPIDLFATSSEGKGEIKGSNGALSPHPVAGSGEFDEDFGEFTTAFADSGLKLEEEWKVNDVSHAELQASETNDKDQVNESKIENHKKALPLSIFGDEELELDGSSNVEDIFVHQPAFMKNDTSPDSKISINDLISNLYSQAEHISPVHSTQVPDSISDNLQDSVSNLNFVNGEDDLDDGEWEFKDGSSEMGMDNNTSLLTSEDPPLGCLSNLNMDDYVDFYSKLKNELSYHVKCLMDNHKRAQSNDGLPDEEAKILTLNKEIEEACKDIDVDSAMCKGHHLEGGLSHNACVSTFIEILREPRYQVLESEYCLSRRLSLVGDDLEKMVDLIRHATMMLKILRSGSLEEQSLYVSAWHKMISVCAQELQHGSSIWKKTLEMNAQSHMLSHPRGRTFLMALGEIYRVAVVVAASVKLCKPWTWLNSALCTSSIHSLLDECHTIWSSSGLREALLDSASSEDESSVSSLLDSLKLIQGLDALALQKHLFAQKHVCKLSLLTSEVFTGMKLIDWNGEHYFLTLANLWANRISSDPPELPHVTFGW